MAGRVLSTETAKQAIVEMQAIVNGELTSQIERLNAKGQVLSDPNVWDGNLAQQFRGQLWPEMHASLLRAKEAVDQLRANAQQINQNIMGAGGN